MSRVRDLDWPVRTDRLLLRPAEAEDADAVWAIRDQASVAEWLSSRAPDQATFRDDWVGPERFPHTLVIELGGTIIGDLMVRIEDPWSQKEVRDRAVGTQAELGWVLDPAYEGHGYATEAVAALLPVCFDGPPTGLGLRRVTALCFADNVGSWKLMERLGMRREEHNIRDSLHRERGWLDGMGYALLAEEWRAQSS